jgi:hypothetical protein
MLNSARVTSTLGGILRRRDEIFSAALKASGSAEGAQISLC